MRYEFEKQKCLYCIIFHSELKAYYLLEKTKIIECLLDLKLEST